MKRTVLPHTKEHYSWWMDYFSTHRISDHYECNCFAIPKSTVFSV